MEIPYLEDEFNEMNGEYFEDGDFEMDEADFKSELARLYEIKKLVCDRRNPSPYYLDFTDGNLKQLRSSRKKYLEELRERDTILEVLERKVNINLWLYERALIFYEENEDNCPDFKQYYGSFEKVCKLAEVLHLEELVKQLGEQGLLYLFHELVDIDENYMLGYADLSQSYKPIKAHRLVFPKGFILWDLDKFLINFPLFLDNDKYHQEALCVLVKTVFRWSRTSLLEVVKQVSNLYYFLKNRRFLFPDLPNIPYFGDSENILELFMTVVANYSFQKYKEELMIKTWRPSRVIDWCFDEDEKSDFI